MSVMEISIKWNVCRVCLSEEQHKGSGDMSNVELNTESSCGSSASGNGDRTKHIQIDLKIAQQIFDSSGIKVQPNDSLPDKICRKCLILLRYAIHFRSTCRNSDDYLQSVIRKTRSATSMLKLDKRRERSLDLIDELFAAALDVDDNAEDEERYVHEASDERPEVIGDSLSDKRHTSTHLGKLLQSSPKIFKVGSVSNECGEATDTYPHKGNESEVETSFASQKKADKHVTIAVKDDFVEGKSSADELVEHLTEEQEEYDDNDIEELEENDCKKEKFSKTTSECSIEDDGYMEDVEEEQIDALHITNDQNAYDASEKKIELDIEMDGVDEVETLAGVDVDVEEGEGDADLAFKDIKAENSGIQEMESYFFIIDEPNIKQEYESVVEDVERKSAVGSIVATDDEGACGDGDDAESSRFVEKSDPKRSNTSSVGALEEYLLDPSDTEDGIKCELELKEGNVSKRGSGATIKISGPRFSQHLRKKVGDVYIYVCDVCGNQFTSRSLMNYHMRIHRNEKNYECELCFKRFTAACNLTAHMRIHTGEKPFECKYCQRRFTDRSTHMKHERVHTNEKPFQCNICGKAFALSSTLRTHEKVHTGEKPFKCVPCNKSFKLPHQLKSHLNTNQHKSNNQEQDTRN